MPVLPVLPRLPGLPALHALTASPGLPACPLSLRPLLKRAPGGTATPPAGARRRPGGPLLLFQRRTVGTATSLIQSVGIPRPFCFTKRHLSSFASWMQEIKETRVFQSPGSETARSQKKSEQDNGALVPMFQSTRLRFSLPARAFAEAEHWQGEAGKQESSEAAGLSASEPASGLSASGRLAARPDMGEGATAVSRHAGTMPLTPRRPRQQSTARRCRTWHCITLQTPEA